MHESVTEGREHRAIGLFTVSNRKVGLHSPCMYKNVWRKVDFSAACAHAGGLCRSRRRRGAWAGRAGGARFFVEGVPAHAAGRYVAGDSGADGKHLLPRPRDQG